ncbi:MAG: hypothetical protein ABI347_00170 [Nitrososphaera sp.]
MMLANTPTGENICTNGGLKKLGKIAQESARSGAVKTSHTNAGKYAKIRAFC